MKKDQCFHEYFSEWVMLYKQGAVRHVTYQKYLVTLRRLTELAPHLALDELDRRKYQNLINEYAKTHEKQTTMDFHHHLKSAILDAVEEGLIASDPTRKAIVKGKAPKAKKPKYLNQQELETLLQSLDLAEAPNWDWFILLSAKTGLRFSETLALTPSDFDFIGHRVKVAKTWTYKTAEGGFAETKNRSSKRTVTIDQKLSKQFSELTKALPADKPVFVRGRVFNSTANNRLRALCKMAGVPVISMHALRHTHASMLIYAGVSIASVAARLGHSDTTTTQEVYIHIIKEMEDRDNEKIAGLMGSLA